MTQWTEVQTVDDLNKRIELLKSCCLTDYPDDCLPSRVLVSVAGNGDPTDDTRVVLFATKLKTFGILEDSEDYTGHG